MGYLGLYNAYLCSDYLHLRFAEVFIHSLAQFTEMPFIPEIVVNTL
jgi:2-C-methyl-D-erythritol 4-phosphate cytidylyltransferase